MSGLFDEVRPQGFTPVRVKNSADITAFFTKLRQRKLSKGLQLNSLKFTQQPVGTSTKGEKRDLGVSSSASPIKKKKSSPAQSTSKKDKSSPNTSTTSKSKSATPTSGSTHGKVAGTNSTKSSPKKKKSHLIESRLTEARL